MRVMSSGSMYIGPRIRPVIVRALHARIGYGAFHSVSLSDIEIVRYLVAFEQMTL